MTLVSKYAWRLTALGVMFFFMFTAAYRGFGVVPGVLTNPGNPLRRDIAFLGGGLLFLSTIFVLMRLAVRNITQKSNTSAAFPRYDSNQIASAAPKTAIFAACLILLLFLVPYLVHRQDVHVKIFDNLDSHIPQLKVLAESGKAFSLDPHATIPNFINGIRLNGIEPGYGVLAWLFIFFGPFPAYVLNEFLTRFGAMLGMYLLMKVRIAPRNDYWPAWIGAALVFSLVPFYPAAGLSVAGIPLVAYAFLNLRDFRQHWTNWVIIAIYPFYSKFAMTGLFVLLILGVRFLWDWIKRKKINIQFFSGIFLLMLLYLVSHFHLFYSFFDSGFVSYREEIKTVYRGAWECLRLSIHDFIFDTVNEGSGQQLFVILTVALAITVSYVRGYRRFVNYMAALAGVIIFNSLLWGFRYWTGLGGLQERFQLLASFNFQRFYTFNTFLWYVLFGIALMAVLKAKRGVPVAFLIILGQTVFMFLNYNPQYRYMLGLQNSLPYTLTYRQFFSEKLFNKIGDYINQPRDSYRVASLGLHPAVSQYNGFYTLDVYADVYPLEYKHRFRRIIEKEISRSQSIRDVFDYNGKRCYLMTTALFGDKWRGEIFGRGLTSTVSDKIKINELQLNISAFKEMGGQYIISAVEILNAMENGLKAENVFTHPESPWKIFLYRAI